MISFCTSSIEQHSFIGELASLSEIEGFDVSVHYRGTIRYKAESLGIQALHFNGGMLLIDDYADQSQRHKVDDLLSFSLDEGIPVSSIRIVSSEVLKDLISTQVVEKSNEDERISQAESIQMFDSIMLKAHTYQTQDIHIRLSKSDDTAYCMFMVDGEFNGQIMPLRDYRSGYAICAALYDGKESDGQSIGNFDESTTRQETQFPHRVFDINGSKLLDYAVRFTKSKTSKNAELLVDLRLQPVSNLKQLDDLDLPEEAEAAIRRQMQRSSGAIFTSGGTGSGKNTLLLAMLLAYPKSKSIQTFEDPIEIKVPAECKHIVQNTIDHVLGAYNQLKTIMRMAPKGIYLTETRDKETAEFVYYIAKSGHFVLSTLHANNAVGCVDRLLDLGVSVKEIASPKATNLLMGQRLIKQLCEHCKIPLSATNDIAKQESISEITDKYNISIDEIAIFTRNEDGCDVCNKGEKYGRKLIVEFIEIDDVDRTFILNGDQVAWQESLNERGFVSMNHQLWGLFKEGLIDISRVQEYL